MLTIRLGSEFDVERVQAIEVDAGQRFRAIGLGSIADDDPPSPGVLTAHIAAGTMWVAELDAVLVGYATASIVDGEAHLDQVSVIGDASGTGVGTSLLGCVCAWARDLGSPSVTLTTFRDVPWNGPYYERRGFMVVDETDVGPELASIRAAERAGGMEVAPRVAMRLVLTSPT